MLYPVFTYDDGTEVTASKPDSNGNITLYVEKFNKKKNSFENATFLLPGVTLLSSDGYSQGELNIMEEEYRQIQLDIMEYVKKQFEGDNA